MNSISISSILPSVNLPDLGRVTLPSGERMDLRFLDNAAEYAINTTADAVIATLLALILVGLGWVIANKLASLTQRILIKLNAEETFAAFVGSIARYTLFFSSVIIALKLLGLSTPGALALFGAAGLATAFALRNTLSHFTAGIMLMANRPFKVGDYIEMLDGIDRPQGKVKRITLFNTEINTQTHERLFLPNSKVWENVLINHSYNEIRMITYHIPLTPEAKLNKIKDVINPILQAEKLILRRPEPVIGFDGFNATQPWLVLNLNIWVRARDYDEVRANILGPILTGLQQAKICIASVPVAK